MPSRLSSTAALSTAAFTLLAIMSAASTGAQEIRGGIPAEYDVSDRVMRIIPSGVRVGKTPPKGWTHIVFVTHPRLAAGDLDSLPEFGAKLASAFSMVCLANARAYQDSSVVAGGGPEGQVTWRLEKVEVGVGYKTGGRKVTVVRAADAADVGVSLNFFERTLLAEQEKAIDKKEVVQIVQGPNLYVFDARTVLRHQGENKEMIMRHAIIVSPKSGGLGCMIWMLVRHRDGYRMLKPEVRFLPSNFNEDRPLYVDASKFRLGLPGPDAIALARLPRGKRMTVSAEVRQLAQRKRYTPQTAQRLEQGLWETLSSAGLKH